MKSAAEKSAERAPPRQGEIEGSGQNDGLIFAAVESLCGGGAQHFSGFREDVFGAEDH